MELLIIGVLIGFILGCIAVFALWTHADKNK
jgi:hypothetical protein